VLSPYFSHPIRFALVFFGYEFSASFRAGLHVDANVKRLYDIATALSLLLIYMPGTTAVDKFSLQIASAVGTHLHTKVTSDKGHLHQMVW